MLKDQFFMKTCVLKHSGSRQSNDTVFKRKTDMFERLLTRFILISVTVMYKVFTAKVADVIGLRSTGKSNQRFSDHLYALDTTSVKFH